MNPDITLLMPAYAGEDFIAESIRSILNQTYTDWHLHISVDAADQGTARVAQAFDDPRITVVVQDHHLGLPENHNWLFREVTTPFACYWQQDDIASTTYLQDLRAELIGSPHASIAYTDVQWFGASFDRTSLPSNVGSDLKRTLTFMEDIRYEPFQGLIRMSHMPPWHDAIPVADPDTSQEEFVLLTSLASSGEFRRVDSAMYFKRKHDSNTYLKWSSADQNRVRQAWISMGIGMARIALDLAPEFQHRSILLALLDRLAIDRAGRAFWHHTAQTEPELSRFVHDFVAQLATGLGTEEPLENSDLFWPIDDRIAAAVRRESDMDDLRRSISTDIDSDGRVALSASTDTLRLHSVLGSGWSTPEPWGLWSDGPCAEIVLPPTDGGITTVEIDAISFGADDATTVGIAVDHHPPQFHDVHESGTQVVVGVPPNSTAPTRRIMLRPHEPRSPSDLGLNTDERLLGVGVRAITFRS